MRTEVRPPRGARYAVGDRARRGVGDRARCGVQARARLPRGLVDQVQCEKKAQAHHSRQAWAWHRTRDRSRYGLRPVQDAVAVGGKGDLGRGRAARYT
jgi:hypothetical protein